MARPNMPYGQYTDWQLQEKKLQNLMNQGTGRGQPGVLGELINLFTYPQRINAARQAALAGYAERFGPQYAKEQNISEDEARQQLTGGVQEQESLTHRIGRMFGFGEAPQGEPWDVRTARLAGIAGRLTHEEDMQGDTQKEAENRYKTLVTAASRADNPEDYDEPIRQAAKDAGYGDINVKSSYRPTNLFDLAHHLGYSPEQIQELMHPTKPTEQDQMIQLLSDPDPAKRHLGKMLFYYRRGGRGGGAGGQTPQDRSALETQKANERMAKAEWDARSKAILQGAGTAAEKDVALDNLAGDIEQRRGVKLPPRPARAGAVVGGALEQQRQAPPAAPSGPPALTPAPPAPRRLPKRQTPKGGDKTGSFLDETFPGRM